MTTRPLSYRLRRIAETRVTTPTEIQQIRRASRRYPKAIADELARILDEIVIAERDTFVAQKRR